MVTFDVDNSDDKDDEKRWSLNAFAVVSSLMAFLSMEGIGENCDGGGGDGDGGCVDDRADKDDEKSWSLNAFAVVSPRVLLFSIAPPSRELAPPLYGARPLF